MSSSSCPTPYQALIDSLFHGSINGDESGGGNPIILSIQTYIFVSFLTFVVSTITKNYSQVDKLWSIIPAVYAWMAVTDSRTLLMAVVISVWAVRLTWNFNRRGGYKWPPWNGDEDYRWNILQDGILLKILKRKWAWTVFNLLFISFYQNLLLLLIATPSLVAWSTSRVNASSPTCDERPLRIVGLDGVAALLVVFFVFVEGVADNQQWYFRREKMRLRESGGVGGTKNVEGEFADGFCRSGLFAVVRKPNYTAEQAIWVSYYLFSVAASGHVLNWSMSGFVLLILLFQGSGYFTELISLSRHPNYKNYMKTTPLYIPSILSLRRYLKKTDKVA